MITKNKIYAYLFVLLGCFGFSENLIGQTELFTVLPDNVSLNAEQSANLLKIQTGDYADQIKFVKIGHLPSIQQNGSISATIPIENTRYTFKARHVKDLEGGEYSWSGDMVGNADQEGILSIRSMGGKVFGHVEIDDNFYRIADMTGGLWVFIQIKEVDEDFVCGVNHDTGTASGRDRAPNTPDPGNNSCEAISVLVIYTAEAENKEPFIWQLANDCIEQANEILMNSAVGTDDARFSLKGIVKVNFEESLNIYQDLYVNIMGYNVPAEWRDNPNAVPSTTEINTIRNQWAADVVVIFTGKKYKSGGRIYGHSGLVDYHGDYSPELAFCIVDVRAALGKRRTFTHELGHTVGLYHEDENTRYGKGHTFNAGGAFGNKKRLTVMHRTSLTKKRRILHFSNPDVDFEGEPTGFGTPGNGSERNSVRKLRESGCIVANFRQENIPQLYVIISLLPCCHPISPGAERTYKAYNINGQAPFQYEWRVSDDGFNYGGIESTSNQLTRDYSGYQAGDVLFIKVKITSANGQTAENFHVEMIGN